MQIAEVALRVALKHNVGATLSYRVPDRLRGLAVPGQLVWAPLRNRRVQGVVLAITEAESANRDTLREIEGLGDPEALIPPSGLQLANWLAAAYHAPLYEALALFLPPGAAQESEVTWRATAAGLSVELGGLPERERAVLYLLRIRGELPERQLFTELRGSDTDLREACVMLAERGLAARGASVQAPGARPRVERMARLLISADDIAPTLNSLARAPRQQAAVRWLAERMQTSAETVLPMPVRDMYAETGADAAVLQALERKGIVVLEQHETLRDPLAGSRRVPDVPPPLTVAQRRVWESIAAALDGAADAQPQTFLLHGVTGSGKTEIYLRAIARALRRGRQALALVPEIALTEQLIRRFMARFPGQIAVLHSSLSLGERYDEWRRLRRGDARIAIGSRSAVFAPLPDLGVIIVDEEHEPTYKHDGGLRYHARDVALQLGELTSSAVILGSATPSVESYYAARNGQYALLDLPNRIGGSVGADGSLRTRELPLPPVRIADMRRELQSGNRSIFSRRLQSALSQALERNEQVILFLNRRGAASFALCRDCGHVTTCPACDAPLVVHYDEDVPPEGSRRPDADTTEYSVLVCHSCNYHAPIPAICPQCLSPRIRTFGIGTQRVEIEAQRLWPEARTLRWDRDTVSRKGAHGRMLERFLRHEADVLIGTQMIAKGLDLPLVSVVGVIAADTGLHLPDFRSGERTFQLLTQVAGRAGRRTADAQVVIQTYSPDHYALQAAQEHDYQRFYEQELAFRRQTGYPPFGRLVRFVYAGGSEPACQRAAAELAERMYTALERRRLDDWRIIGPAPAFRQRVRGRWRWHIFVRIPTAPSGQSALLLGFLESISPLYGWTIDVDPVSVL